MATVSRQRPAAGEFREAVDRAAGEETLLHVGHRVFHHALRLRVRRAAGLDLETVVVRKILILRVEHRRRPRHVREDGGLAVVYHHFARHAAEFFKRALVAAQPPLLALAEGKLDVEPAAMAQDQDKKTQRPPRAVHVDRAPAAPVHLGALAGRELQGKKRLRVARAHAAHVVLEDRIPTGVALLAHLVPELHRGEGMRLEPAGVRALVGVEFARARCLRAAAALVTLHREPPAHGLHVQVEGAGDLRRGVPGGLRVFDFRIQVVVDHDVTSWAGGRAAGDVGVGTAVRVSVATAVRVSVGVVARPSTW